MRILAARFILIIFFGLGPAFYLSATPGEITPKVKKTILKPEASAAEKTDGLLLQPDTKLTLADSINYVIELFSEPFNSCWPRPFFKEALTAWAATSPAFFVNAEVGKNMPEEKKNVRHDLRKAFAATNAGTLKDSLAILVNYVFVNYNLDEPKEPLETRDIDEIATLLASGRVTGLCGDQTNYLSLIITRLFPWWGHCVQLTSTTGKHTEQSICDFSHVFLGLADQNGEVLIVADPTVNAVWTDSVTGNLLTLRECRRLLRNPVSAWRVNKFNSTYFGKYRSVWSDSPYDLLSVEFASLEGITAHAVAGQTTDYIITGPLKNMDDEKDVLKSARDFDWQKLNFPRMTWANNMLTIKEGWCADIAIQNKFTKELAADFNSTAFSSKGF